jgi:hypothetical protein
MQLEQVTVNHHSSFIYFVYPFTFDADRFTQFNETVDRATIQSKNQDIKIWQATSLPKDDLLFHVANYLNPSNTEKATAKSWKLSNDNRICSHFGLDAQWKLYLKKKKIDFYWGQKGNKKRNKKGRGVDGVSMILFNGGVGFLIVQVQPIGNILLDWLDFLHFFRFLVPRQGTEVKAYKKTDKGDEDYFPKKLGNANCDRSVFKAVVMALLQTVSREIWWDDIFVPDRLIPFVCLYVNDLPQSEINPFHLLYKLQHFFNSNQGEYPAPEHLDPNPQPWLAYARNHWFIFTLEGGTFLAIDSPEEVFFKETLPQHLKSQYFLLFLLAQYQRFALMSLSQQVANFWLAAEEQRLQEFERIRDRLFLFTARGYFTQVMQRDNYHRCYRKWQEVLQLEQLYREVHDEVHEMQEYLNSQSLRRLEVAEKQRERERQEEKERQEKLEKQRERERQEEKQRQTQLEKQREQQYLQELRSKDEAQAKRDRELQDLAYIISGGLGGAAIFASSAGLLTAGSNNGEVTVEWIPTPFNTLHPVTVAISLSFLAALLFGFAVWGIREGRRWVGDRRARRKLEAFCLLLERDPAWLSWGDREWLSWGDRERLAESIDCEPNDPRELWEAIARWCQSQSDPRVVRKLAILEKRVKLHAKVHKNYKAELRAKISPPTAAQKTIEGFLQLLHNQPHLFDAEARNHLAQQNWSAEPEKLAEQISKWCQMERRSAIYAQLLEEQNNLPANLPISQMDRYSDRLHREIHQLLHPPKPPSLGWRVLDESLRELEQGWQRLKRSPPP